MKSKLITILFLLYFTNSFSQKKDIILIYGNEKTINKENNIFKIENEDFRYLKEKHKIKKNVLFQNISKKTMDVYKLKSFTKQKMKNDKIKDNFIQSYFEKYFNLFIYVKNSKCENEGTLYEVEWIFSITEPEID